MKKSRFSEGETIGFLKQAGHGLPVKELCRLGSFISRANFYNWRQILPARQGGGKE